MSQQAKVTDFWYVDGQAYDMTQFLDHHPGGRVILEATRGHEIGWLLPTYHALTPNPNRIATVLEKYKVAKDLRGSVPNYPKPSLDDPLYRDLREMILQHFGSSSHKAPWSAYLYTLVLFLIELVLLFYWMKGSLVCGWLVGVFHWLAFIGVTHDGSHLAWSKKPWMNRLAMATCLPFAYNPLSWVLEHIVYHHPYTNDIHLDVDTQVYLPFARTFKSQKWFFHMPFLVRIAGLVQLLFTAFFMTTLWPLQAFLQPFTRMSFFLPTFHGGVSMQYLLYLWEGIGGFLFSLFMLIYPFFFYPNWNLSIKLAHGLAPFMTMSAIFTVVTQISHLQSETEYLASPSWAKTMVQTAVDYKGDSFLWTLLTGGLNAQSFHHLFPTIHSWHYSDLYPKYLTILSKYNLSPNYAPNVFRGFLRHRKHLRKVNLAK